MVIPSFAYAGEGGNSSADGRTTKAPPPAPAGSPIKNGNVETGKGNRVERLGEFNFKVAILVQPWFF